MSYPHLIFAFILAATASLIFYIRHRRSGRALRTVSAYRISLALAILVVITILGGQFGFNSGAMLVAAGATLIALG